jgi:hypothetical protein
MISDELSTSLIPKRLYFILILAFIICIFAVTGMVSGEKIKTNLTIGISPEDPTDDQVIYVSGHLLTDDGKPLGNKRVVLESSQMSADDPDSFELIITKDTERDGGFDFTRPADYGAEYIRVTYAGNDNYQPATSKVIAVKGAGTNKTVTKPQKSGSVVVHTTPMGANITVDDIFRGVSPYTVPNLLEGPHTLVVSKDGYKNQSIDVYVTSKIDSSFDVTLLK